MEKAYTIELTVKERYEVVANSKKEALSMPLEDPFEDEVKSKKVIASYENPNGV